MMTNTTQPMLRVDHLALRTPDFALTINGYLSSLDFSPFNLR